MDIISVSYQSIQPPEQQSNMSGQLLEPAPVISENSVGNILIEEMKRYFFILFIILYLVSEKLLRILVGFMLDRDAPNSTSSLTNGINIIMELIRRYCRYIVNYIK